MSIVVAHVKGYVVLTCISPVSLMICSSFSSKLPDDVFGPGERPTPPKALKRKKSSKVNISSSFSTAECLAVMQMRWTPGSVFYPSSAVWWYLVSVQHLTDVIFYGPTESCYG